MEKFLIKGKNIKKTRKKFLIKGKILKGQKKISDQWENF